MSEKKGLTSTKLATMKPVSPVRTMSDHTASAIGKLERLIDRMTSADKITDAMVEQYETYRTQVQYEMRKGRYSIFRRLEDLLNVMLDQLEAELMQGEANITPSQVRLYMNLFLEQTRNEFDPKDAPNVLVDQRQQIVQVIEVEKTYDNDRVIDVKRG
jgi:hypothetical protein